ncbi:hypothetical protein E3C22_19580 [Jiella endophytica]|uniref:SH3 domain-containing protein n=1 Tax=Jiella endophytica TaxID=2558362 RepID=A0A4Y8RDG7_9HYPH|nr:hypothetical protein [Jiella endophytica]TFF19867.1 hypothetical protein E3C22_19580 [Jiella endophytica]
MIPYGSTMKSIALAISLLAIPCGARAASVVADGHEYDVTCTADGYRLASKYPVSRMVGTGAGSHLVEGREILYLGRSCDAYTKVFGYGSWCWANGGFFAKFDRHHFGFPRQELACLPEPSFQSNCGC